MKLRPESTALSSSPKESSSLTVQPKTLPPSTITGTWMPVFPRLLFCILCLLYSLAVAVSVNTRRTIWTMSFRLRIAKGKLKIEHSILDRLRPVLDRLVLREDIRSVIPGVIRPVRDAKGIVKVRITVPTQNGWKAIGLANGARQELFISTAISQAELAGAIEAAIAAEA